MDGIDDVLGQCVVGSTTDASQSLCLHEHDISHTIDDPVAPLVG